MRQRNGESTELVEVEDVAVIQKRNNFGLFIQSHNCPFLATIFSLLFFYQIYRYIKESEDLRRAMMPLELIKRVKEIEMEAYVEPEAAQERDTKQTAAVDLISRLNNKHSYSDAGSMKALEEWRKRKMERARQREHGKDGTLAAQA